MSAGRLFQIINIILERGTVTAKELADRFEVSVRTVYRDIDTLSVSGIPVYTTKGRGGGISLLRNYVIDKSLLTGREQEQILLAIKNVPDDSGEMKDLLQKLGVMFKTSQRDWMEVDFARWGTTNRKDKYFDMLKEAILSRRMITFSYVKAYSAKTSWLVYPLKIVYKSSAWYLQAYSPEREANRTFKLGRMSGLHVSQDYFDGEYTVDPIDNVSDEDTSEMIIMRFDADMTFRVLEEFDEHDISTDKEGRVVVTARIPDGRWLYAFLLSFGQSVEVLEPKRIRAKLAMEAKRIYESNAE